MQIMIKIKDKEHLEGNELGKYGTFKKFVKKDIRGSTEIRIICGEPNANRDKYRYGGFGASAKLLLTSDSYYTEKYEMRGEMGLTCRTCGEILYSEGKLTIRRETPQFLRTPTGGETKDGKCVKMKDVGNFSTHITTSKNT